MSAFETAKKIVAGDVAHDAADAGSPIKIGGKAATATPTAVAAGDRVNAYFDANGRQVISIDQAIGAGLATAHHAGATATGNGTNATLSGRYSTALIVCNGAGTVNDYAVVELSPDGTYWHATNVRNLTSGRVASSIPLNPSGQYTAAVAGAQYMRVRIVAYTSGSITISSECSQWSGEFSTPATYIVTDHHSAAGATAAGTATTLDGMYSRVVLGVYSGGTGVFSITPQGSFSSGFAANDTSALQARRVSDGAVVDAITSDGLYAIDVSGFSYFRANLASYTSGSISAFSRAIMGGAGGGAAGDSGVQADSLTALEAIQAAVEDTTTLTASGTIRTGGGGWTTVLANAATANASGSLTVPDGARRAMIIIGNGTDVTLAPIIKVFSFSNYVILVNSSSTVAAGATQIWHSDAGFTGSTGIAVAMLGALIPGIPLVWSMTITGRTTGSYTVTIYWGS